MSRANSVAKVLRVAYRRVEKRWGKGQWSQKGKDEKGGSKWFVCLEGSITGGCQTALTPQQREALDIVRGIVKERKGHLSIPSFNDDLETTQEEVLEILKLAIIREEFGDPEDLYADDDEVKELLNRNKE